MIVEPVRHPQAITCHRPDVVAEKGSIPNAETIAAMKEARAGNLPRFNDVQSLLEDLHAVECPIEAGYPAGERSRRASPP